MIEIIVLKEAEFKELELREVGKFAKDNLYRGKESNVQYLLSLNHDSGIGLYYRGIKILSKKDMDVVSDNETVKAKKM